MLQTLNFVKLSGKCLVSRWTSICDKSWGALITDQRRFKSVNANEHPQRQRISPVYVHHVSKIVLEHLQDKRVDWVEGKGLNGGLHINPNGTFILRFPSTTAGYDAGKIWTSYDTVRKQHWLSVYRQNLAVRFLLRDHSHGVRHKMHDSRQTDIMILNAVEEMISAIDQSDSVPRFSCH